MEHAGLTLSDLTPIHKWKNVLVLALLSNRRNEVELVSNICIKLSGYDLHSVKFTHGTLPRCREQTTLTLPSRMPEVEMRRLLD